MKTDRADFNDTKSTMTDRSFAFGPVGRNASAAQPRNPETEEQRLREEQTILDLQLAYATFA